MAEKRYTEKDLTPIIHNLRITRDELWGYLNLVRMNAESYDPVSLTKLAGEILKKYKMD